MALRHDPTKHNVIIYSGIGGVLPVTIVGHDMSDWATVSQDNPNVESDLSGDGQVTYNKSVDSRASISIKIKQNSASISGLDALLKTHAESDTNIQSIIYTNSNTLVAYTLESCYLEKIPDESASDKNGTLEYKFLAAKMEKASVGGIILSSLSPLFNSLNVG